MTEKHAAMDRMQAANDALDDGYDYKAARLQARFWDDALTFFGQLVLVELQLAAVLSRAMEGRDDDHARQGAARAHERVGREPRQRSARVRSAHGDAQA